MEFLFKYKRPPRSNKSQKSRDPFTSVRKSQFRLWSFECFWKCCFYWGPCLLECLKFYLRTCVKDCNFKKFKMIIVFLIYFFIVLVKIFSLHTHPLAARKFFIRGVIIEKYSRTSCLICFFKFKIAVFSTYFFFNTILKNSWSFEPTTKRLLGKLREYSESTAETLVVSCHSPFFYLLSNQNSRFCNPRFYFERTK